MGALASAPVVKRRIDGKDTLLKDPKPLLIEGLSLPQTQLLPGAKYEYVEFGEAIFAGPMGSGKSKVVEDEFAIAARDMWTEYDEGGNIVKSYIEFFKARDIGGTIKRLMESDALIKFVFFDDAVGRGKDARESMSRENRQGTQKFLVIRHLIEEGILKAGYVILVLATQDLTAIDKRIRNHAGVLVLKGYVDGCDKFLEDNPDKDKIIKRLKYLSYNAAWRHCNDIKKIGIAIDLEGDCYEIITELIQERIEAGEVIQKIDWIEIEDGTTFNLHFNELAEFALDKLRQFEGDLTVSELKGAMLPKLAEMTQKYYFCEVSEAYFQPIIWTAKWTFKQEMVEEEIARKLEMLKIAKAKKQLKRDQTLDLQDHCFQLLKAMNDIKDNELKGALYKQIREFKEQYGSNAIKKKHLAKIIAEARFQFKKFMLNQEKLIKLENKDSMNDNKILETERPNTNILILRDVFKKSFREIGKICGISNSTAHDRYYRELEIHQNALKALENNELEMEG